MFVESGMSVAGVIVPPPGYLAAAYSHVRAQGGVCVADEVQVGFGRFGKHYWGFEQQGVVPDIVTCGKPFGNGCPIAAVVCTSAVSERFAKTGMEYFNTFGGQPACCAAGLAMLDVLESDRLVENAVKVGAYLMERLAKVAETETLIGDVRGSGLFIGVELVRDRQSKVAADVEASAVCSRMKETHHILTTLDGVHDNVIVIKPPMCFSLKSADMMADSLVECLHHVKTLDLTKVTHTPT